jgi:ferredoxin-NADP reductase
MKLKLIHIIPEVANVKTFVFTPQGPLAWIAGQSIRLELPRDSYGVDERRFTISSAPHQKNIHITTRLSDSEFKRHLFGMQPGEHIDAYAVDGTFTWPNSLHSPIFMAAGIGITPFHAMLHQRMHEQKPLQASLFYSNSTSDFVFKNTLERWQTDSPGFVVNYLSGQRLTRDFIHNLVPNLQDKTIYISGPTAMVDDIGNALLKGGHSEHLIKRDWFTGNFSAT